MSTRTVYTCEICKTDHDFGESSKYPCTTWHGPKQEEFHLCPTCTDYLTNIIWPKKSVQP